MSDKITLLIVDDEIQFLKSITKRLELRGFDVSQASSGTDALEIANTQLFDLAVLDLKMPGMDGQELLDILKRAHKYLEVVILAGHGAFDSAVNRAPERYPSISSRLRWNAPAKQKFHQHL